MLARHEQDILVTVAGKPHAFVYLAASPEAPDHAYDGRYGRWHSEVSAGGCEGTLWGLPCDMPQATVCPTVRPLLAQDGVRQHVAQRNTNSAD